LLGISFRRCDQLKPGAVWGILGKVVLSNATLGLSDRLEVHLDRVRMPAGTDKSAKNSKGRSIDVLSVIKKSIVTVKTAFLCLAHTLIIVLSRVNGDPKYTSYSKGKYLKQSFEGVLSASGLVLTNREGVNEKHFQNYLSDYKIIVYGGLILILSFSVEIPVRTRNCTFNTMLDTSMSLQILKL